MKKTLYLQKAILLIFVFLFLLTGCGQEKPPVNYNPPVSNNTGNTGNDQTEFADFVDNIPENSGSSKPIDITPFDGLHITAQENAFWNDTTVDFKPIKENTETIKDINELLYENEGVLIFSAFEVDAGLKDDEFIPGQYDVEYDLKSTDIDPAFYEFLKVYRIGDDGSYYELNSELEGNVLSFSCNQNSIIVVGGSIFLAGRIIKAVDDEYNERNLYYIGSGRDVLVHEDKNIFGKWRIEWLSSDIDPNLLQKLKRMTQIEYGYKKEAEKYYSDDIYAANNVMYLNKQIFDYTINKIEADEEHKKLREQISMPDEIKKINSYIDNAFRYLYQEEKMRMPLHRVPFKLIRDSKKDYLGLANNRALSSSYIDINLNKVNFNDANTMYNLQLTLTHELLHICQIRYRFPIDAVSDNTRYDEMVAQFIEEDALAYFIRKDIIPESANLDLTRTDYWGNLRLPINGEEDNNIEDKETRQDEVINCGYNLGSFLRYLCKKEGKRPSCHTIMKARSYLATGISGPLCDVFGIDERAFDMYFRNWIISNRSEIAKEAMAYVMMNMYGLDKSTTVEKGGKYHKDFIHSAGYFLNIRTFEISKNEKDLKMLLVPDQNLLDVFPSANFGTGLEHRNITAGQYIDKFLKYSNASENCYLPVLEVQGYAGSNDPSGNAGYTIYVLDRTPSVRLNVKDDKLQIVLPKPEPVAADGVADGYILKIVTGKGKTIEKEIPKEYFGKVLEMNKSELYDDDDMSTELNVKATLNEFFLEGDNKIMGIESDEMSMQTGGEQCEIVIVRNKVTYKLSVKGAIVYGENPKGIIYCQAKPGSPIDITVTSSDEAGVETSWFDHVPSGSAIHWTMGDMNDGDGYLMSVYGKNPDNGYFINAIGHLMFYPVKEYTEKPLWTFEPSWSETKKN